MLERKLRCSDIITIFQRHFRYYILWRRGSRIHSTSTNFFFFPVPNTIKSDKISLINLIASLFGANFHLTSIIVITGLITRFSESCIIRTQSDRNDIIQYRFRSKMSNGPPGLCLLHGASLNSYKAIFNGCFGRLDPTAFVKRDNRSIQ